MRDRDHMTFAANQRRDHDETKTRYNVLPRVETLCQAENRATALWER